MSISVNGATTNPYVAAANAAAANAQNTAAQETTENGSLAVPQDEVSISGDKPEEKKYTYGKPADPELIEKLKAEVDTNYNYLKNIVEGLITKQGKKINSFKDLGDIIRGKDVLFADADTIAKAKADVAEDGYWGVDQTAGRILDFAKALIGDDMSKLGEMRDAIEKGFSAAKHALGLKKDENLPDISMQTYDKIMETLDSWEAAGKIE